ncbi:DNA recombination protein RmuC [Rickettsiaceae bacterium]|nr:DNA recombination protein RmuC [Rickettsiaceae bacterium]
MQIIILIIGCAVFAIAFIYSSYRNIKLGAEMSFLQNSNEEYKSNNYNLENEKIEHIQKIEQLSSNVEYQKQLIDEFERLKKESNQSTKASLFELGNELSKQLIEIHKKETKDSREFAEKNIENSAKKFNSEFERIINMVGSLSKEVSQSKDTVDIIKNSLLSPSGAGSLAEITLENMLKSSGLRVNLDFIIQYSALSEENTMLRPDAIIFLPNDRLMIVDAKASKFLVDDHEDLKNLSKTMNNHLRSLSSKGYAEMVQKSMKAKGNNLKDAITLMFLPSEHAIEKLMDADSDFMNKAWKVNIFPVGPAGLMNMLSFAKFQISEQMMAHNHLEIIEEVKKLVSSISSMAEHSIKLGNSISSAANHYDKFTASFNRNFLSKARKLGKMGIDSSLKQDQKNLPRFQIITSKSELIEVEPENVQNDVRSDEIKKLEEA